MTCYNPQGNNLADKAPPLWYPCNYTTSDGFVPCCQTDLGPCLPNLACGFDDQPETLIRGGCTDSTFKSKNCPQFLLDVDPLRPDNLFHNCGNGTGCYNTSAANSQNDCSCAPGTPNLLLIFSNSIVYADATTASSVSSATVLTETSATLRTSTSSLVTTTSTSASPALTSSLVLTGTVASSAAAVPQASGPNLGLVVGLAVGLVIGLPLLGAVVYLLRKRVLASLDHTTTRIASEPGLLVSESKNHSQSFVKAHD